MKSISIKELSEYIPYCIICQKNMHISLRGNLFPIKHKLTGKKINIKTKIEGKNLVSDNKNYPLSINLNNLEITNGLELISDLSANWLYVDKQCATCNFVISTIYIETNPKSIKTHFPYLKFRNEFLSYTMPGGKPVKIYKSYYEESCSSKSDISIMINYKSLPPFSLDFSTMKNLKNLNKRLSTIRTFQ